MLADHDRMQTNGNIGFLKLIIQMDENTFSGCWDVTN